MRVWDVSPGYLNRGSLLGEHRELHGIISIIANNKKGYSKHPETLRWIGFDWALIQRHKLLVCEMQLRGYKDKSPISIEAKNQNNWPNIYIDKPITQYNILSIKYLKKEQGRIDLPTNICELWAQHKYSVMARSIVLYKDIGKKVAKKLITFEELALILDNEIKKAPKQSGIRNSLEHMWGYISHYSKIEGNCIHKLSSIDLFKEIQKCAIDNNEKYLLQSTALSELGAWITV